MKKPLVIIAGPTAVGKTSLSVKLAKKINGSIISADSMQVYKYMDIGSAKIRKEEMEGIPHYLVDILSPEEEFNVSVFQTLAKEALNEIYSQGRIPIIVGGTGFYIQALLYDIDFTKEEDEKSYRNYLEQLAKEKGNAYLFKMLEEVDVESTKTIHMNNVKRVIRALEYYHDTGEKISEHNEKQRQKQSPYNYAFFVLTDERATLYERIDKRVDIMLEEGLEEEVTGLKNRGYHRGMVSMQGLGYKEMLEYLEGEISLEEAVYKIKRDTRHFAKRQITWFKREPDVIWLNRSNYENPETGMLTDALQVLNDKNIVIG